MIMENQRKKIGVAICGLGKIGAVHLNHVVRNPRVSVKWLVEEDRQRALELKHQFYLDDSVNIVDSSKLNEMLQDVSVEVVLICTPVEFHPSIIKAVCKAGKAVFCEKPIALTVDEVKSCYSAARSNAQLLYCAYNRHFDPSVRDIYKRVKAGEIGQVKSIKTTSRDHPEPSISYLKTSGGIFFDCATHDMDMICWIMGGAPSTVYCQAHAFNPEIAAIGDYDQAGIMMQFPGGATSHIDVNRSAVYGYDQRLEVFGSKGVLESKNYFPTSIQHHGKDGQSLGRIEDAFTVRYKESYRLEFEHFLNVYQGIEPVLDVSEDDCIRVTRLSQVCRESMNQGKPVNFTMD